MALMYSEQEKKRSSKVLLRRSQWRNAIKLAIAYFLLIVIIFTLDYFDIPEDKAITTGKEACAVMGDEVITMNECYDMMLNGL